MKPKVNQKAVGYDDSENLNKLVFPRYFLALLAESLNRTTNIKLLVELVFAVEEQSYKVEHLHQFFQSKTTPPVWFECNCNIDISFITRLCVAALRPALHPDISPQTHHKNSFSRDSSTPGNLFQFAWLWTRRQIFFKISSQYLCLSASNKQLFYYLLMSEVLTCIHNIKLIHKYKPTRPIAMIFPLRQSERSGKIICFYVDNETVACSQYMYT